MKVRKLAVALALAGGLGSGVAQALGLGEIDLQSYLNEPLDADITLNSSEGVSPNEVFANLASEDAYRRVGLDRSYFLTKLRFNVSTASDGNLVVTVSSTEPVKEPYLNFLLEVTWPNGRLMREYAILVDPPVYAEDSGVREPIQAPAAAPAQPATSQQRVVRQQPASQPTAPRTTSSRTPGTFGPTGPSDTLWGIASAVRPNDSVTQQQVMLAIQDLNPDAFIGGNINRLKRGQVLRVPSLDQIQSRTRAEATREVTLQNESIAAASRAVDAREQQASSVAAAPAQVGGDELKLLVGDGEGERAAEEGGSAGGQGQLPGGADAGAAVAMEQLEATRRENQELSGRVEDLQDQVETLQRLLELKNSQLAELEQGLATDDAADAGAPGEPGIAAGVDQAAEAEGEDAAAEDVAAQPMADAMAEAQQESAVDVDMAGVEEGVDAEADAAELGAAEPGSAESSAMVPEESATMGEAPIEEGSAVAAPVVKPEPEAVQTAPVEPKPEATKEFPGNLIDAIVRNPMYQIALGGGLVLLLLLLLLVARRNASKEKEFYEQLNSESDEDDSDTIALTGEDEEVVQAEGEEGVDPIAEADTYVAYGRLDQAAHTLENAISRAPSRTDLRLKLLGVYADSEDRDSFEKQFGELAALEDAAALAEAETLRSRLEEAEAMPSIDDLESQLMSDSFSSERSMVEEAPEAEGTEETLAEQPEPTLGSLELGALEEEPEVEAEKDPDAPIEYDLSGISLNRDEAEATGVEEPEESLESELASLEAEDDLGFDLEAESTAESTEDEFGMELGDLDESLDLGEVEAEGAELSEEVASLEDEFESLDLDEDALDGVSKEAAELAGAEELPSFDELVGEELSGDELTEIPADLEKAGQGGEDELSMGEDGALDESFLDELDAELDKVAGADESEGEASLGDEGLDDLELDISDEDLALMEEVADTSHDAQEEVPELSSGEELSLDEELGLDDALLDEIDEQGMAEAEAREEDIPVADESVPTTEEAVEAQDATAMVLKAPAGIQEIDESELGEDDDFDFLAGTDEAATKLDLARAYIEMGDSDGARDILEEVAIEGDDQQKVEAQDLLKALP